MAGAFDHAPVTEGRVSLDTAFGRVEVELYPKYAPKACKNFVQLCVDQVYDKCVWERVERDAFVELGGCAADPELLPRPFPVEKSRRLKFRQRGVVAMVPDKSGLNQWRFCITLAEAPQFDGVRTVFGQVTPESIFPLLRMNDMAVDAAGRPLEPPLLNSASVVHNPFDDVIARASARRRPSPAAPRPKRRRAVKDKALLSCAAQWDELEEGFDAVDGVVSNLVKGGRVASAHDVIDDDATLGKTESHSAARKKELRRAHARMDRLRGATDQRTERLKAKVRGAAKPYGRAKEDAAGWPSDESSSSDHDAAAELPAEARARIAELQRKQEEVRREIVAKPDVSGDGGGSSGPKSRGYELLAKLRAKFPGRRKAGDREKETTLRVQQYAKKLALSERKQREAADVQLMKLEADKPEHVKADAYADGAADKDWFKTAVEFVNPKAQVLANRQHEDAYEVIDPLARPTPG